MNFKSTASLAALLLGAPLMLRAQNELSNFTATGRGGVANTFASDYQAIGINPGNLGRIGGAKVAFTVGEFGLGAGTQSLTRDQFRNFIYDYEKGLTRDDKLALAKAFTSDNALNANADATTFALAVAIPSLGTVAISNRQRIASHVALNQNAAEIMFLGKNAPIVTNNFNPDGTPKNVATLPQLSSALDGTALQLAWYNEYNIAYGNRVIDKPTFQLSVGGGYRYIQGIGVVDVRIDGGAVEAYSALSPLFKINYGSLQTNPNASGFNYRTNAGGLQPVGTGHGFDFGVAMEAGKALRLGLSLTDMGKMTWEGNLLTANDQKLRYLESEGVNSYNFIKEAAQLFAGGTESLFQYQAQSKRTASLPTKLRAGAGFRISEYFETGLDVTLPMNKVAGNLSSPFVGLGVDYKPTRWVRLSSGVTAGAGYSVSVPLGVTFTAGPYEGGISTRDLTGLLFTEHPYISMAAGFLRFKFGKVE
ncbi:DUF5723 family protein [Hymenobacter sp. BT175]|uniref:DUF5723 family protein n=1 Tax=Hymenobacter translucens TaxID=2886507 RepID=UPI001D0EF2E8|nr:DUF5723 family protein [Hymenobacter translucens]MCC2546962.1 DUF5723 family protein [Hymenobacter translucens]